MVIMNDLEWPMLSYYVIYYEKFRNVMQRTEKVALNLAFCLGLLPVSQIISGTKHDTDK